MSKELVPITNYAVAEMLPDYLNAEEVGVNAQLIGKVAQLGCFKPDVQIAAFSGSTTQYEVNVAGFAGYGTAYATASRATTKAPLSDFSSAEPRTLRPKNDWCHSTPGLTVKVNAPEIYQTLRDQNKKLRDPRVWSQALDASVSDGLRQAARSHIVSGNQSCSEALRILKYTTFWLGVWDGVELLSPGSTPGMLGNVVAQGAGNVFFDNLFKFNEASKDDVKLSEACFSLIPGYHWDRYALVSGLTRARRLVRPIK